MLLDAPKDVLRPVIMRVVHLPRWVQVYHCVVLIGAPYKDFRSIIIYMRNTCHWLQLPLQNQLGEILNPQESLFESCKNRY